MDAASTTFAVGNWLAAFSTGLLLLLILIKWGHKLPHSVKLDDILRVLVAVIAVAGPLYSTPRFHEFALTTKDAFESGALGVTVNPNTVVVIGAIIVLLAVGWYLNKPSGGRLAWLVVVTLPLFTNETMLAIAQWWTNHLGSYLFRVLIDALNWAAGY